MSNTANTWVCCEQVPKPHYLAPLIVTVADEVPSDSIFLRGSMSIGFTAVFCERCQRIFLNGREALRQFHFVTVNYGNFLEGLDRLTDPNRPYKDSKIEKSQGPVFDSKAKIRFFPWQRRIINQLAGRPQIVLPRGSGKSQLRGLKADHVFVDELEAGSHTPDGGDALDSALAKDRCAVPRAFPHSQLPVGQARCSLDDLRVSLSREQHTREPFDASSS